MLADRKKRRLNQAVFARDSSQIEEENRRVSVQICTMALSTQRRKRSLLAVVVADRFHVARKYRECADNLRKSEIRQLKKEMSPEEYEEIKGAMWPGMEATRSDRGRRRNCWRDCLRAHRASAKHHRLREELTAISEGKG
ncbi:MAG: transposase [Pyrinomonadaceae bacterium]